jgi:double-stranded uracil-DNA glycosylase
MTSVLPDVVACGLDIIFCGTAAGAASAQRKAYYAGPGNVFWPTLHRVGLTPHRLKAEDYRSVIQWNLGLTDLAKSVYGADAALKKYDFCARALEDLVRLHKPRIVAFTSKRAAEEYFGSKVSYGLQEKKCAGALTFVLPSPSGLAKGSWDEGHWRQLAKLGATARRD